MSKKKQLSGKKTKLDKLPLTKALARQQQETPVREAPRDSAGEPLQGAFSWETLEEGAAGLLTAAYLLMVRDLLQLKEEVPWASEEEISLAELSPPSPLPTPVVKEALRQAKQELQDLSRLLSPPK